MFYVFVAVFIVATTVISLYAAGYKFNLSWPLKFNRLLIKTGMLIVDSNPSGADIYLNGRQETNHSILPWQKENIITAAKIKNILPGEYDLRLELDGYWPFEKKIDIYSNQTTFAEDINLFRSDLPILISSAGNGPLSLSASKKYLYASGGQKIIFLKNETETPVENSASSSAPIDRGQWLTGADSLFLNGQLIAAENGKITDYRQVIGTDTDNWHYDEESSRIYYQNKNSLGFFDINSRASQNILNVNQLIDYYPAGNSIFLITKQDKQILLNQYKSAGGTAEQTIILPAVGNYSFAEKKYNYLEIYDKESRTLYLANPDKLSSGSKKISDVISWQWLDENTIVYNNAWEIRSFDLKTGNISLITRVSEEIKQVIWNKSKNYLIFTTDKALNTLDLGNGTITAIFKMEKILSPILDEKGDSLYFWAKIGQQEGVYQIMLQ